MSERRTFSAEFESQSLAQQLVSPLFTRNAQNVSSFWGRSTESILVRLARDWK